MPYINDATKQEVLAAVGDQAVADELAATAITEAEAEALTSHLQLLAAAGGTPLWPPQDTWLALEQQALLEQAAASTARLTQTEAQRGGRVIRDSVTMMLELVHVSGDPAVLRTAADTWLWGPTGPPCHGNYSSIDPTDRYAAHAAAVGQSWNRRCRVATVRHEVAVQTAALARAHTAVERYADLLATGYGALADSESEIAEGCAVAAANPQGPWPAQMSQWSDIGWASAQKVSQAVDGLLQVVAAAGIIAVLDTHDSNEERGILVAASRARPEALRRWWARVAPARPDTPEPGRADVSFWLAESDPAAYWGAAMTAAILEVGRARHGGPAGVAAALLNR